MKLWLIRLSFFGVLLALTVIILGAYTRLSEAGLGCPDWPGCYGQFSAPSTTLEIQRANQAYPNMPVNFSKARIEMTHRYFAESLGLVIIVFASFAYWRRRIHSLPFWLPALLVLLVLFQGLLGMWTVTMRLLPLAVMGHLLGGFCTVSLLWWCWLQLRYDRVLQPLPIKPILPLLTTAMMGMLILQIFLGGWTSANYAALICADFPTCQGQWWVPFDWHAFNLLIGFGKENPIMYMDGAARATIHFTHRLGALCTLLLGILLIWQLWRTGSYLRYFAGFISLLLLIQISLGISNIVFLLPLPIAVAHNAVAALLLLAVITVNFTVFKIMRNAHG